MTCGRAPDRGPGAAQDASCAGDAMPGDPCSATHAPRRHAPRPMHHTMYGIHQPRPRFEKGTGQG